MGALERARADIEEGRLWKARDRLQGHLRTDPHSQDALRLLGEICLRMGDLPAAGKYWFLTEDGGGAGGQEARQAFEERCGRSPREMLDGLPVRPPFEAYPRPVQERLYELARAAGYDMSWWSKELAPPPAQRAEDGIGVVCGLGCLLFLLATVGIWILGLVFLVQAIL